jgi:hypothetical protein
MSSPVPLHVSTYPKVWNVGHQSVKDLFEKPVHLQEKVDGSQISFGRSGNELAMRSKGAPLHGVGENKMFDKGIVEIQEAQDLLMPGYTYRGEYLEKPKHNTLIYERVPRHHIAIFDVQRPDGTFLEPSLVAESALELGFDVVPSFGSQLIQSPDDLLQYLERDSFLGGTKIEGVVAKRYDVLTQFGDPMFGKYVSEAFKETHRGDWKDRNPTKDDILTLIVNEYRNPVRWAKAAQHMRDAGTLEGSPRDIGPMMAEVKRDILAECQDEIAQRLFKHFWKQIERGTTQGLPEWWKRELLEGAFT